MGVAVALFTRDLRVRDNPMLAGAVRDGDRVVPLFVLDEAILTRQPLAPNRIRFLLAALAELDAELRAAGGRLILRRGAVVEEVARVVGECGAESVHIAADVSHYSLEREQRLRDRLARSRCRLEVHPASVTVVDPVELRPATGRDHFAVFTPYFNRWVEMPLRAAVRKPSGIAVPEIESEEVPAFEDLCPEPGSPSLVVGGERSGRKLLSEWLSGPVERYESDNDLLAVAGTSRLSPFLHFGCLSPVEVVRRTDLSTPGGLAFARQLAWRDFHHQLLAAQPETAWRDYRPRAADWREDPQAFEAWRAGRTGYPVIDAGMRQLLAEGWMPGRARLIAASFLTKNLRIDWRLGAAHFLHWLVDGDIANNQLNWQWAAGTGTDTRPNRVLNPIRQAERYDPDGEYVRRWLPELAELPGASIHKPWRAGFLAPDYPPPLVECKGM
ncbi:cryptochrome/photolyase family protein [Nocardia inohanensis]|uniref:cryptochrome/photolyase family protein n=1 Tax=Nocardia inohanensis TaxID=209246 RepID=UPI00082C40F3|nr:deoxyribodipyrimidine photo-lyase [Nocardia inohanensis]